MSTSKQCAVILPGHRGKCQRDALKSVRVEFGSLAVTVGLCVQHLATHNRANAANRVSANHSEE